MTETTPGKAQPGGRKTGARQSYRGLWPQLRERYRSQHVDIIERIRQLDDRQFSMLCLAILKEEISPEVRLVSIAGPDGGRDAYFNGKSDRFRGWSGYWLFQFKHYKYDQNSARRKFILDLKRELKDVVSKYSDLKNYIILTSIPFSGTQASGTFDVVGGISNEYKTKYSINVDVWDGLEISYYVASNSRTHTTLLNISSESRFTSPPCNIVSDKFIDAANLCDLNDDAFEFYIQILISTTQDPLGPNANTHISTLIYDAQFNQVKRTVAPTLENLAQRKQRLGSQTIYWSAWLHLAMALAEVRTSEVSSGIRRATKVIVNFNDSSIRAWAYNILSIGYGKKELWSLYILSTQRAINYSRNSGNIWLEASIRLRVIHKEDWRLGENGDNEHRSLLLDKIQSVAPLNQATEGMDSRSYLHLLGQIQSYSALHFRWKENEFQQSRNALRAAAGYFGDVPDRSEMTRVISETGIVSRTDGNMKEAIETLKQALSLRVDGGELARARYDLLFLAEAYVLKMEIFEAGLCAWLGMQIHEKLYDSVSIDSGIVGKLTRVIEITKKEFNPGDCIFRNGVNNSVGIITRITGLTFTQLANNLNIVLTHRIHEAKND